MRKTDLENERQLLAKLFDINNVPDEARDDLTARFHIEVARVTRPKWEGRVMRGGELAILTAPAFLRHVHPDYVAADGTVQKEVIRAIDNDLLRAVEGYISHAEMRGTGLKDAEGLRFILAHPGKGKRRDKAVKPAP